MLLFKLFTFFAFDTPCYIIFSLSIYGTGNGIIHNYITRQQNWEKLIILKKAMCPN